MKKIMIVDDEQNMVTLLRYNLEGAGYTTLSAESGESALCLAQSDTPDLVLLDCMMPGIDGYETCRQFKQHPKLQDIPIIMVTCCSGTVDAIRGLQVGVVDYVTKPVDPAEIVARVRTHLRDWSGSPPASALLL